MRKRTPSAWQCSTSSRANRFASPDSSCAVYVAPASFGATWRRAGSIRQGLVDGDQAAVAAERAHLRCGSLGGRELRGARIEMQDALRALVVIDADVAAQLLQHLAAVGAEPDDVLDVAAGPPRRALAQERERPEPLMQIRAGPEQQRRVFPCHPLQHL